MFFKKKKNVFDNSNLFSLPTVLRYEVPLSINNSNNTSIALIFAEPRFSNFIYKIQTLQSECFRKITKELFHVSNDALHKYVSIPTVQNFPSDILQLSSFLDFRLIRLRCFRWPRKTNRVS